MLVFPNFSRYINYDNFSNNDSHTLVFEEKIMAWWLRLSIMFEVQASNLFMDTSFSQMDFIEERRKMVCSPNNLGKETVEEQ